MSAPQLIIDPNVVDYGELLEDVAYPTGLTLRNISDAEDVVVTNVVAGIADITFPGLVVPFTIGPGESYQLDVTITPDAVGAIDTTIAVTSNSITSVDVADISYEGIAAGTKAISVSPAAQTFPDTKAGEQSAEIIFTVTCTGSVATTVSAINFPTDFVAGATVPTLPDTLNPEETLTFGVKFAPSAQGFIEGTIEVVSDAAASPFEVEVSGMGFLIESAFPVGPIEPEAFVVGLLSADGDSEVWQSTPAASHLTQLNCESEASLVKMLNFGAFADKLIRFFWMHFEDLGEGTVTISLENQMTGVVKTYSRTIGEGQIPPERILRDMFEVLLEAENVLVRITKAASSGALSIIDYGLRYLPSHEARGTLSNPTTITPAYIVNQCPEFLNFGLVSDEDTAEVWQMDVLSFAPESPARVKNAVLLPFPTDQGPIPGFTYEKQVMRVFFHYEDFGPAVVTVAVTTMRGQTSSQNVSLGTADGDVGCVQIGIADLLITDEVHEVRFIHVSGVVSILDYTVKYEIKGEREKTTPVESLVGCDEAPLAIAPCIETFPEAEALLEYFYISMDQDDDYVYLGTDYDGSATRLSRVLKSDLTIETITLTAANQGGCFAIQNDATYIYCQCVKNGSNRIIRVLKSDFSTQSNLNSTLLNANTTIPKGLYIDTTANLLYFNQYDGGGGHCYLGKIDLTTFAAIVTLDLGVDSTEEQPQGLIGDSTHIYVSCGTAQATYFSRIFKVAKASYTVSSTYVHAAEAVRLFQLGLNGTTLFAFDGVVDGANVAFKIGTAAMTLAGSKNSGLLIPNARMSIVQADSTNVYFGGTNVPSTGAVFVSIGISAFNTVTPVKTFAGSTVTTQGFLFDSLNFFALVNRNFPATPVGQSIARWPK